MYSFYYLNKFPNSSIGSQTIHIYQALLIISTIIVSATLVCEYLITYNHSSVSFI